MADIRMERKKSGKGWLWALLALLLIALIAWWLWQSGTDDEVADPAATAVVVEPMDPIEPVPAQGAALQGEADLGSILEDPQSWVGRDFPAGEARVAEVVTDRGFWITGAGGARLFAILVDQPAEQPLDINPEQTVRITGGTLRDASHLSQLAGAPIDDQTRGIAEGEEVFLVVDEADIEVVEGGEAQGFGDGGQ